MKHHVFRGVLILAGMVSLGLAAGDWPTLGHDNRRSHVSADTVPLPAKNVWTMQGPRPCTAWPGPAKWDAYAAIKNLASMRNFDPSYAVTVVGDALWYGSSADDAVHCLDVKTGKERWVFTTDGPVRLPPSWADGRLYAASDDGKVYCLDPASGTCLWSYSPMPKARRILADGKLISPWPCRTGVLVQGGHAIFGASLLPWRPSYLCSLDVRTGKVAGTGSYKVTHRSMSMQGPLVASRDRLFISQGRQQPVMCDLSNGSLLGALGRSGDGGVWGLVTDDGVFLHGRGQNHGGNGELRGFDDKTRESVASFPKARRLAITSACVYILGDGRLRAFDRARYMRLQRELKRLARQRQADEKHLQKLPKDTPEAEKKALQEKITTTRKQEVEKKKELQTCVRWSRETPCGHALILAGNQIFAGGTDIVIAYAEGDGRELWRGTVNGTAYSLAVAGSRLFVSTGNGAIHCFAGVASADGG